MANLDEESLLNLATGSFPEQYVSFLESFLPPGDQVAFCVPSANCPEFLLSTFIGTCFVSLPYSGEYAPTAKFIPLSRIQSFDISENRSGGKITVQSDQVEITITGVDRDLALIFEVAQQDCWDDLWMTSPELTDEWLVAVDRLVDIHFAKLFHAPLINDYVNRDFPNGGDTCVYMHVWIHLCHAVNESGLEPNYLQGYLLSVLYQLAQRQTSLPVGPDLKNDLLSWKEMNFAHQIHRSLLERCETPHQRAALMDYVRELAQVIKDFGRQGVVQLQELNRPVMSREIPFEFSDEVLISPKFQEESQTLLDFLNEIEGGAGLNVVPIKDTATKLLELKALLDADLISEDEFAKMRQDLLKSLS